MGWHMCAGMCCARGCSKNPMFLTKPDNTTEKYENDTKTHHFRHICAHPHTQLHLSVSLQPLDPPPSYFATMPPKTSRRELTATERQKIVTLDEVGYDTTEIQKETGWGPTTIRRTISNHKERGTVEDLPRSGAPRKISHHARLNCKRKLNGGELHNAVEVKNYLDDEEDVHVTPMTVRNMLHQEDMYPYKKIPKPLLNSKHKAARVALAKEYLAEGEYYWQNVVFSDEATLHRVHGGGSQYQWLSKGARFDEKRMQPTASHGGGGVHMWAALCPFGVLAWTLYEGHLTAETYVDILKEHLIPAADEYFDGEDWLFQHDGASVHTAQYTSDQLELLGPHHDFDMLGWAAHSPDLNPIENFWAYLNSKLGAMGVPANLDVLRERVTHVMGEFRAPMAHPDYFVSLYSSVRDRLHAVISARGAPTKY